MASRQQDEKLQIVADAIGVDCLSSFNLVCLLGLMLTIRSWLLWISYYTRKCNKNHRKQFSVQRKVELQASWRFFLFCRISYHQLHFDWRFLSVLLNCCHTRCWSKKMCFTYFSFSCQQLFFPSMRNTMHFVALKEYTFCISIVVQCQKLLNLILIHDGNRKFGSTRKKKKISVWNKFALVGNYEL